MENKEFYALGVRDGMASILAAAYGLGDKLPWLADEYFKTYGEKHFSHDFHLQKETA